MNPHDPPFPTKPFASCFALAAFAIAIIAGLGAGRDAFSILATALAALFICHFLGSIAAAVIEAAVREHIKHHRLARPIPDLNPPVHNPAEPVQPEQTD